MKLVCSKYTYTLNPPLVNSNGDTPLDLIQNNATAASTTAESIEKIIKSHCNSETARVQLSSNKETKTATKKNLALSRAHKQENSTGTKAKSKTNPRRSQAFNLVRTYIHTVIIIQSYIMIIIIEKRTTAYT